MTTDPLPTHDTRVVPPPPGGVHLIEYSGEEIFMLGWDGDAPQPISLYANSYFSVYTQGQQVSSPFRLIPDDVPDSCHSRLSKNQQNLYTPKFLLLP